MSNGVQANMTATQRAELSIAIIVEHLGEL